MKSEDIISEIVQCLRYYSEGLNHESKWHKKMKLFPQSTRSFKEPGKLRLEGAESALKAMADHIEECFQKGVFE